MTNMKNLSSTIEVEAVTKRYELFDRPHQRLLSYLFRNKKKKAATFDALKGITFSLAKGETLGIIGRNGSGKSTLLQIVCGTLTASSGEVRIGGRIAALLELGAGFNPEFTGRENILLNASIYGLSRATIESRLDDIIAFAEIGDFIDQPVQHYSSGMFVRLAFAVIAHVDADILIIDEALAVGDALFSQKCMRFLEQFKKTGSILFVSHDSGAITRLCDRALWIERGEMMQLGDARGVSEAYLEHLYATQQSVDMKRASKLPKERVATVAQNIEWIDMRSSLLKRSNQRNDIEVFRFDPEGSAFGTGLVEIENVYLEDISGCRIAWAVGGAAISLVTEFVPSESLSSIIVGFMIKDRLGQVLFGDNNCIVHQDSPVNVHANRHYRCSYSFILPYLPVGDYVVTIAVASGTQQKHVQHCWRHDALVFNVHSSHVVHGLMGIPVLACEIIERDSD